MRELLLALALGLVSGCGSAPSPTEVFIRCEPLTGLARCKCLDDGATEMDEKRGYVPPETFPVEAVAGACFRIVAGRAAGVDGQ